MTHIRLSHLIYIAIFITSLEDRLLHVQAFRTKHDNVDLEDATRTASTTPITTTTSTTMTKTKNLKDPLPLSITRKEHHEQKRRLLIKKRHNNVKQHNHKDHSSIRTSMNSNRVAAMRTNEHTKSSSDSLAISSTSMIQNNPNEETPGTHKNTFFFPEWKEQNSANMDAFARHVTSTNGTSLDGKNIIETAQNQKSTKGQRWHVRNRLPPMVSSSLSSSSHANTIDNTSSGSLIRSSMGIRQLRKATTTTSQNKILKDDTLKQDNSARFRKVAFVVYR